MGTYEQLMEMGDNAGKVNKGYQKSVIASLKPIMYSKGKTNEESCSICFEDFEVGAKVKELGCKHAYCAECIDKWLENEKRCCVCNKPPFLRDEHSLTFILNLNVHDLTIYSFNFSELTKA